ncbi:amino acid transporter AVT1H-like [Zingiber officinale]|uniref:amino acid transporter AVT1H-like n=1 Tax=Zingiber officinale TaxID=94328 RepID=UPI001C4DC748|nr:amino acid transporter AVT1H-like [Zingiber officinale]
MKAANCVICVEEIKVCAYASEANAKATSSFTHSVINMVGMLIGLGQLSAPYTLENGGWSSAHIIGRCLDDDGGGSKSYQDIGEQAFGSKGRIIASAFIYLEIFFALVSYTISLSDNLPLVLAGLHAHAPWLHLSTAQLLMATAVLVALLVALPTLWLRDMSSISFLSLGGILMSLFMFATVAWVAAFGGVEGSHEIPALRVEMLPRISGLYMFSFAGHIVFPNIYTAMKDPSKFTKVSIASFAIVTLLYTALAFMGAQGGECDSWANSMGGGASHVTDLSGRETLVRITARVRIMGACTTEART